MDEKLYCKYENYDELVKRLYWLKNAFEKRSENAWTMAGKWREEGNTENYIKCVEAGKNFDTALKLLKNSTGISAI